MSVPDPPVSFSSSSAYIQCLDAKGAGWERPCILSPPTWPFRGSIHLLRAGDLAMECFRCCGHISWNLGLGQFSTKLGSLFFPSMWLWSRSLGRAMNSGGGLRRHKDWSWEAAHTKTDRSWGHSLSPASHVVCLRILPKCPGYDNLETAQVLCIWLCSGYSLGPALSPSTIFTWTLPIKHCWSGYNLILTEIHLWDAILTSHLESLLKENTSKIQHSSKGTKTSPSEAPSVHIRTCLENTYTDAKIRASS